MDEIINVVIRVVAALLAFGAAWLGKWVVNWLKANMNEKNEKRLEMFITELVEAAEQMYKQADPDGSIRFRYVESMLLQAGYDITDAVKALIESKVFKINTIKAGV